MPLALASRYARALVDVVVGPSAGIDPRAAAAELEDFEGALAASPQFRSVLLSPAVAAGRKRAVIALVAGRLGVSRVVRNFLYVVINHRRIALLPEIRQAFQLLLDERLGVVEVNVASARELSGEQREAVAERLSRLTGRKTRCRFSIDEHLIGGLTARIGSRIYDGSVRGQLEKLSANLMD